MVLVSLLLSAASAVSGFLLLQREPLALPIAFVIQLLQVLGLGTPIRYVFLAGVRVGTLLSNGGVQLQFALGSEYSLTTNPPNGLVKGYGLNLQAYFGVQPFPLESSSWSFFINWVAVYLALYLWREGASIAASWKAATT